MSTLKELIEGRELPVKVRGYLSNIVYTVTHKNKNFALLSHIEGDSYSHLDSVNYELYEEPKKKVKVALYAYKNYELDPFWKISSYMYSNDKDAKSMLSAEIFKRLDWSEIEVNNE